MKKFTKKTSLFSIVFLSICSVFIVSCHAKTDVKSSFNNRCAKCHGENGKATRRGVNLGAKNFSDINWQKSVTDEDIINAITNGKNKMPSWKKSFNQEEIKELAHYVRVLLPRGQRKNMPKNVQKLHYK